MTLHAKFLSEGRKAQYPPDPRYPLGITVDGTEGRPSCTLSLQYPAPCIGKWLIRCDQCGTVSIVTAAGRADDPHTVRLPCKPRSVPAAFCASRRIAPRRIAPLRRASRRYVSHRRATQRSSFGFSA